MQEQRIGGPYGDIFSAGTPALDNLSKQLYNEHQQRDKQREQQIISMDNEFSKNVANIRDADVADIAKLYGDWKSSTQQLMKQKGGATPEQQLENLRKKAEMYKALNESKSFKEREEFRAKRYAVKASDFIDEAGDLMTKGRNLPISQLRQYKIKGADGKETIIDLTNDEPLLYQDKTNWQPILQKAAGTLTQRGKPLEEDTPDKLQKKIITYKGLNSPIDFYTSVASSFNTPRADEHFANRFSFSPQEAQTITEEFNRVKDTPEFKQVYGDVSFPSSSDLTPGLKTAKLLAMQHAIHNQPTSSFTMKDNKGAVMDRTEKFKKLMADDKFEKSKALISLMNYYRDVRDDKKAEAVGGDVDAFIDEQDKDAEEVMHNEGKAKKLKVSNIVLEAFKNPNTLWSPTDIYKLPNGDYELVGGENFPKTTIPRSEYKAAIVNKVLNTTTKINQVKKPGTSSTNQKPTKPKPY